MRTYPFSQWGAIKGYCDSFRKTGKEIILTTGCFDILHVGHLELIRYCIEQGQVVIVGLNSDESIRRLKGPTRPFVCEEDRGSIVFALHGVVMVTLIEQDTPCELIEYIKPTIYVKGGDYDPEKLPERATVLANGGVVLRGPFVPGWSTTTLARRLGGLNSTLTEQCPECGGTLTCRPCTS